MTYIYSMIGRAVVRLAWRRFGTQMQAVAAVGIVAVGLGLWLAGRTSNDVDR